MALRIPRRHRRHRAPERAPRRHRWANNGKFQNQRLKNLAWDRLALEKTAAAAAAEADAVCFGTLGQRREPARGTIQALLAAVRPGALRISDIHLRRGKKVLMVVAEGATLRHGARLLHLSDSGIPLEKKKLALALDKLTMKHLKNLGGTADSWARSPSSARR